MAGARRGQFDELQKKLSKINTALVWDAIADPRSVDVGASVKSGKTRFRLEIRRCDWLPPPTRNEKTRCTRDADRRGASARATERRARGAGSGKRTRELDVLRRREVIAQQLLRREHHGTGEKRVRFSR